MYERTTSLNLPVSTTILPNNLSKVVVNSKIYLGIIHKSEFIILNPTQGSNNVVNKAVPKMSPAPTILQASWIDVGEDKPVLVLAMAGALQIFDWDGSVLLFTHISSPSSENSYAGFFRGICGTSKGVICVGTHAGEILCLETSNEADDSIYIRESLKWFVHPVTFLAAGEGYFAASDDSGSIIIAEAMEDGSFRKTSLIDSLGSRVNSMVIHKETVVAGYDSGHIRIFNCANGKIIAEVCAHVRGIASIDVAPETGMLLSVSEDTFARVWKVNINTKTLIEHKYSKSEDNHVLTGGRFMDDMGCGFYLSSYDDSYLITYIM